MVQGSSNLRPPTLRVHCGDCGATLPRCRWHRQPGHPTRWPVARCRAEAGLPWGSPTEAGSLGSPTTSMPAISIARRPTILHRWGYGWICLDFSIWCSTSDFSSCLFGTALLYSINLYSVWYCRCVFVATLQRWWSNINCACSNSPNLE